MNKTAFWTILILSIGSSLTIRSCVNEFGKPVNWFFAIRTPSSPSQRKYIIYDNLSTKFRKGDETILQKLFEGVNVSRDKIAAWSDQKPGTTRASSGSKAHAKGIMVVDHHGRGFILNHSVPRYPVIKENMIDWVTNTKSSYGQSFVCMSVDSKKDDIQKIYDGLVASNVDFYEDDLKYSFKGKSEGTTRRMFGRAARPLYYSTYVEKMDKFQIITKSRDSTELPFEDMLSSQFETGWLVESWGRPYLKSNCNPAKGESKVINITELQFEDNQWRNKQDHSKWAISETGKWVCFGDLNHMTSQAKRGGSFYCKNDSNLHKAFSSLIKQTECNVSVTKGKKKTGGN